MNEFNADDFEARQNELEARIDAKKKGNDTYTYMDHKGGGVFEMTTKPVKTQNSASSSTDKTTATE